MSTLQPRNPDFLTEPLAGYLRQYEYMGDETERLVTGLSDHQFNWRPAPDRWSIAQCLGHLLITGGGAVQQLDRLIEQAERSNLRSAGPFRRTWLGDLFIQLCEPPYRVVRVKTLGHMVPPPTQPLVELVPAFLELQEQVQDRIRRAAGVDLGAVRQQNPAGVTLTLGQWFEFIAAHERRHLWQARNVRTHRQFPSI